MVACHRSGDLVNVFRKWGDDTYLITLGDINGLQITKKKEGKKEQILIFTKSASYMKDVKKINVF